MLDLINQIKEGGVLNYKFVCAELRLVVDGKYPSSIWQDYATEFLYTQDYYETYDEFMTPPEFVANRYDAVNDDEQAQLKTMLQLMYQLAHPNLNVIISQNKDVFNKLIQKGIIESTPSQEETKTTDKSPPTTSLFEKKSCALYSAERPKPNENNDDDGNKCAPCSTSVKFLPQRSFSNVPNNIETNNALRDEIDRLEDLLGGGHGHGTIKIDGTENETQHLKKYLNALKEQFPQSPRLRLADFVRDGVTEVGDDGSYSSSYFYRCPPTCSLEEEEDARTDNHENVNEEIKRLLHTVFSGTDISVIALLADFDTVIEFEKEPSIMEAKRYLEVLSTMGLDVQFKNARTCVADIKFPAELRIKNSPEDIQSILSSSINSSSDISSRSQHSL